MRESGKERIIECLGRDVYCESFRVGWDRLILKWLQSGVVVRSQPACRDGNDRPRYNAVTVDVTYHITVVP
jgi:hypothetical protein